MTATMRWTALAILLLPTIGTAAPQDPPAAPEGKPVFWIVPHTHWEGAVFKTREEYLDLGLPNILKALRLLDRHPEYRFVLDQAAYVKPFLERYPEEADRFRKFVKEGRLELVLGMDVMPDLNIPGGETLVRQIQYGKGYFRDLFGVDVKVGWLLDTFGHPAQMPQIMTLAGYTSYWSQRGAQRPDHPSEFLWEGIDGSRMRTFLLPYTYAHFHGSPAAPAPFDAFARKRWEMLAPHATGSNRLALAGVDVSEPESALPPMLDQFNRQPAAPFLLRFGSPSEIDAAVAKHPPLSVVKGELNPIFRGTYSSRIELKHEIRLLEQKLALGERLACLRTLLGANGDDRALEDAWEPLLFNTAHDLASGVMTDGVYADTLRGFDYSKKRVDQSIDADLAALLSRVDTSGEGIPVVVLNPLGWERSDVAEVTVGFSSGAPGVSVWDPEGNEVPAQVLRVLKDGDGTLRQATVAFTARRVPAAGYSVYRVRPKAGGPREPAAPEPGGSLENDLYALACDPVTGAVVSLRVKDGGWETFRAPANVVARQDDAGDVWELYRPLDGAQKLLVTERQGVPQAGKAVLSGEYAGVAAGKVRKGPVFSEFESSHPLDDGGFATRVRLYSGLRRVDFETTLVNNRRRVRYQALFPTSIRGGTLWGSIPFGAIERPEGVELPAQTWVDYGDGRRGVALLNVGHPGNYASDGTLLLSLLRAHNLGTYGFGGGYEPGMTSDTGFELNRPLVMRYALVPHAGDWREARVFRDGMELNHPLVVRKAEPHAGPLPPRWGLVEIDRPNVVLSALQPAKDGAVTVRIYEATGVPASGVRIHFRTGILGADVVDLMDRRLRELSPVDGSVTLDLKPFQILTLKVTLGPLK